MGDDSYPAGRITLFTFPYSRLWRLNGNLALRGRRLPPPEATTTAKEAAMAINGNRPFTTIVKRSPTAEIWFAPHCDSLEKIEAAGSRESVTDLEMRLHVVCETRA
ncbi:hypothetical protein [Massilia glaciei]|uniref:hypothetical protein n=1 Tax=Massilia glaciei TaxID=1524097 RepID=UPI0011B1D00D|nr:hypothetical protein [Massilia glaciei]